MYWTFSKVVWAIVCGLLLYAICASFLSSYIISPLLERIKKCDQISKGSSFQALVCRLKV